MCPAEKMMVGKVAAVEWMTVLNCFFIPMGEQPPWMYPVKGRRSFCLSISTDFSLTARAAFFKSSSSAMCA